MRRVTRVWQGICALRAVWILVGAWLLFVLFAYPGLMTIDSFDQLGEARHWSFSDSHPPVMAALWGIVDRIHRGPFGMLAIQSTAFLAGLYLLLCRALRPTWAAAWASVIFLFPPVIAPMAVIWKDCQMAGFLVLGIALICHQRRGVRVAGLGAFFLATAMRYNAGAATLPLLFLLFEWQPHPRWLVRYGVAFATWVLITAAALGVNRALVDRKTYFWYSSVAIAEIAGTLAMVDEDLSDDELRPILAPTGILIDHDFHRVIRARYKSAEWSHLVGTDPLWQVPLAGTVPAPEPQRDAISHAWSTIVFGHPGAYLKYRFDTFAECLGLRPRFIGATVIRRDYQNTLLLVGYQIPSYTSWWQRAVEHRLVHWSRHTGLFRPYAYALLALALLAFCRRERDVLAVLLSGLFMELSLLPLSWTPDFRYSHWLVVCACIGVVMLIARRRREGDIARAGE